MKKAVYKDGGVVLSGLSESVIEKLKEDLTFDNPAYATTKKFSRYQYTNVPRYLTYYTKTKEGFKVPIGYFDPEQFKGTIEDTRVRSYIKGFPKFVLGLRETQKEAAQQFLQSNDTLPRKISGCIQMPTGKGKTILALYVAAELKRKTLVVVHKSDLVTGWLKDIKFAFGGKMKAGLIKAQSREVGEYITIATIQTLNRLSEDEREKLYKSFGFVIQDEMHHCPASTFGIVANFNSVYKLGLTATPERSDGLEHVMQLYFGDFCYRYEQKEGEVDEDILPVKVKYRTLNEIVFNPICREVGRSYKVVDFKNRPLKKGEHYLTDIPYQSRPKVQHLTIDKEVCEMMKKTVCRDILNQYHKGHSCIVFFTQVETLLSYYDYLLNEIEDERLDDILSYYGNRKFNDGNLRVAQQKRNTVTLTTYAKTTEGTDCRMWEVAFLVSSLNNGKNVEQVVGRIRRTNDEPKLKTAVVYDYRLPNVYGYLRHFDTRLLRYRKLRFDIQSVGDEPRRTLFTRGFRGRT